MAFLFAAVESLMLCAGRLFSICGCSIGAHSGEHCADGSAVVLLTHKVLVEYKGALADWSEKAKDRVTIWLSIREEISSSFELGVFAMLHCHLAWRNISNVMS